MATNAKTQCFICKKETRTFNCEGCLKNFCRMDLTKHLEELSIELDKIESDHDQFRQNLIHRKDDPNTHSLIQEVNKWEEDSIQKIKEQANQCRERIIKYSNKSLIEIENKLNELAKQIIRIRQENEYNEIDLNQLKEKLNKLNEELNKSSNISLEQQVTSFVNKIFIVILIDENTRWKQNGITVAGGNGQGDRLNQLFKPAGICLDVDQTIYIADWKNHRIVAWEMNATNGRIVAGGNGIGNQINQLNEPIDLFVDKETNSLITSDHGNRRIMRWSLQNNTKNGEIIISDIDCCRITMDKNGSLYVSDYQKNEVRRWKRGETNGTIVAGGNGQGDQLNQLNCPTHVFLDENGSLYISDRENHRVVKWLKDAKEGIIVAGGNGRDNSMAQLSRPHGVFVDQSGQIYVADFDNHRVMCWREGDKEGTIVVGGSGKGQEANQLSHPKGLAFDRGGNLYVVDYGNDRVQKFEID